MVEPKPSQPVYDVFLSHNSADKPSVEALAARLEDEEGLKAFLDAWHLVPGEPWQEALETALDKSATCAVFLGPEGMGSWENEEMRSALDERSQNKLFRVIPVLLPGANPKDPAALPRFLRRTTWVDFRTGLDDPEAFHRLVAGIRGEAPGRTGAEIPTGDQHIPATRAALKWATDHRYHLLLSTLLILFAATVATVLIKPLRKAAPMESKSLLAERPILKKITELLSMARLQSEGGEYAQAWELTGQALQLQADSPEVQREQAQIAMTWLRDIRIKEGESFTGIVDKILPCLYRSAAMETGAQAADALAHIGYANFLKRGEGTFGLKIEDDFREALKRDPQNVYAHTFWGFWILGEDGELSEANPHFLAALKTGRERSFVRSFQIAALMNVGRNDYVIELIRVMDDMRKNQESLGPDERHRIEGYIYYLYRREVFQRLQVLPPADHLATYLWLIDGFKDISMRHHFIIARLTEATGDLPKALSLYRSLQSDPQYKTFTFGKEVEDGIKRCESRPA